MLNKIYNKILNILFKLKFTLYDSMDEYNSAKEEEEAAKYSFSWYVGIFLKIFMAFFILLLSFILFGCSTKTQIEYVPVSVPVACDVEEPQRPLYTGDVVKDNIKILMYAEELNAALKKCK